MAIAHVFDNRAENLKRLKKSTSATVRKQIKADWQLYLLLVIPVALLLIFSYYPMYGIQIAFKEFFIKKGIWGSPWVGFDNFTRFFESYQFVKLLKNTIFLSLYSLITSFPVPIILALALNNINNRFFKKSVQMIAYAPYFISTVVLVGIMRQVFAPRLGIINQIVTSLGGSSFDYMGSAALFPSMYVWSGVWAGMGFSSIIYLAVLSNADQQLHEAATIDGANKLQRMWHIDMPCLVPTAVVLLIMNCGSILNVGFEKVFLMQNDVNIGASEVISTYIYKVSLAASMPDYSYGTAIGLFQSLIGLIMVFLVNKISNKVSGNGLW